MNKIIIAFIAFVCLVCTSANAQFLKKLKDKVNNAMQGAQNTNASNQQSSNSNYQNTESQKSKGGKFTEAKNVAELLANNIFIKEEGVANVGTAEENQAYFKENYKTYFEKYLIFGPNGNVYFMYEEKRLPHTYIGCTYRLDGNNIEYTARSGEPFLYQHKGKIYSNKQSIKIVYEVEGGTMEIIYSYKPKSGTVTHDLSTIVADKPRGDASSVPKKPKKIDASLGKKFLDNAIFSYGIDGEYLTYHLVNGAGFDFIKIPFKDIKNIKVVRQDPYYYLEITHPGNVSVDKHYTSSWREDAINPLKYYFDRWQLKDITETFDKIVAQLPKDKQADYAKLASARKSQNAEWAKEDVLSKKRFDDMAHSRVEEALQEQESTSSSSSSTSSSPSSSSNKVKTEFFVKLRNKSEVKVKVEIRSPKGSSKSTFEVNQRTTKSAEVKVGSTIYINGGLMTTIAAGMEGQEIIVAQ